MSFQPVYTDKEIMHMKTRLRAMERKRDTIAVEAAKALNLPNIWTLNMINWDDERVSHLDKRGFLMAIKTIGELQWRIREAEALDEGCYDWLLAEKEVNLFLFSMPLMESLRYLKNNGLTKNELIRKVVENPNYLKEHGEMIYE